MLLFVVGLVELVKQLAEKLALYVLKRTVSPIYLTGSWTSAEGGMAGRGSPNDVG